MMATSTNPITKPTATFSNATDTSQPPSLTMLTTATHEADVFKSDFEQAGQCASKSGHIANTLATSPDENDSESMDNEDPSPSGEFSLEVLLSQVESKVQRFERERIAAENEAKRSERALIEAETRLRLINSQWIELEQLEDRLKKARNDFSHLIQAELQRGTTTAALNQSSISLPISQPGDPSLAIVSPAQGIFRTPKQNTQQVQPTGLTLSSLPSTTMSSISDAPTKRVHRQSIIEELNQPRKRPRLHEVGQGLVVPSHGHQRPLVDYGLVVPSHGQQPLPHAGCSNPISDSGSCFKLRHENSPRHTHTRHNSNVSQPLQDPDHGQCLSEHASGQQPPNPCRYVNDFPPLCLRHPVDLVFSANSKSRRAKPKLSYTYPRFGSQDTNQPTSSTGAPEK